MTNAEQIKALNIIGANSAYDAAKQEPYQNMLISRNLVAELIDKAVQQQEQIDELIKERNEAIKAMEKAQQISGKLFNAAIDGEQLIIKNGGEL